MLYQLEYTMKYLAILFILIYSSVEAKACKCFFQPIEIEYKTRDFIVEAKIVSIKSDPSNKEFNILELKVNKNYKGKSPKYIRTEAQTYRKDEFFVTNSCGMDIQVGERWLLFGNQNGTEFTTYSCTASTKRATRIAQIIKELRSLKKNK